MLPTASLDYVHKFVPARSGLSRPVTLLLLHGTGGDESSLLPIGNELWPGAALLGLRGKVLEKGMPDCFRRFTEPGIDDVRSRTEGLAQFIRAASERYRFSMRQLIVVGYSNGANLAASLILLHPHYLAGAILFRAMVPLVPEIIRDFGNLSVFIGAAQQDPLIPPRQAEELAAIFQSGGADVTISWRHGSRELGEDEIQAAKNWLHGEKIRRKIVT
jgi:phospholipase/carboxylesterase